MVEKLWTLCFVNYLWAFKKIAIFFYLYDFTNSLLWIDGNDSFVAFVRWFWNLGWRSAFLLTFWILCLPPLPSHMVPHHSQPSFGFSFPGFPATRSLTPAQPRTLTLSSATGLLSLDSALWSSICSSSSRCDKHLEHWLLQRVIIALNVFPWTFLRMWLIQSAAVTWRRPTPSSASSSSSSPWSPSYFCQE